MVEIFYGDWSAKNANRKHPIDDNATCISDTGDFLPESFLVEAAIWVPNTTFSNGKKLDGLYISSAHASKESVTITVLGYSGALRASNVLGADDYTENALANPTFMPICTVFVGPDFVPYKNYPVSPVLAGVSGWVMFGQITESAGFDGLFSTPQQSAIAPRCVRPFVGLPVASLSPHALAPNFEQDVSVLGGGPLNITVEDMQLFGSGITVKAIRFDLPDESLADFTGPCGGRPGSGTCEKVPIRKINDVPVNEVDDICMLIEGFTAREYVGGGGLCLDTDINISEVCTTTRKNQLPTEPGPSNRFRGSSGYWWYNEPTTAWQGFPGDWRTAIVVAPISTLRPKDGESKCFAGSDQWCADYPVDTILYTLVADNVTDFSIAGLLLFFNGTSGILVNHTGVVYSVDGNDEPVAVGNVSGSMGQTIATTVTHTPDGVVINDTLTLTYPQAYGYRLPSVVSHLGHNVGAFLWRDDENIFSSDTIIIRSLTEEKV